MYVTHEASDALPTAAPAEPWSEDFVELYHDRYRPMVRLAYLLTGSQHVAEELVQDAFVSVYRRWDRAVTPRAYLRTAVVNACRSWGRRKVVEIRHAPRPLAPALAAPDEMWDVLHTLPARQRVAIVLRFYEDLPEDEIARVLDCRPATVRTSIFRGSAALRKEISR